MNINSKSLQAFKYTTKGYVNLRVGLIEETEGGYNIGFEVKDTGIGISEEAGKTLFKPLFLSGDTKSERKPTDGMCHLAIQEFDNLFEGSNQIKSTNQNSGSIGLGLYVSQKVIISSPHPYVSRAEY